MEDVRFGRVLREVEMIVEGMERRNESKDGSKRESQSKQRVDKRQSVVT